MNKSRGSGRPACEEAAADAGYASGTWRRAASLSGQAGAGGRADVELLIPGMGPGSLGRWEVVENGSGANDFLWVLLRSWRLAECANSELPAPACWETRPARAARDVRDGI